MRKILMAGLAALTLGGSMAATTVPADAAPHGGGHGGGGGFHGGGFRGGGFRGGRGFGFGAGLAGFALGAAIADGPYGYYGPGYYDGYYGGYGYGYGGGPYGCVTHRRVWDPYVGAYVVRPYRYAC